MRYIHCVVLVALVVASEGNLWTCENNSITDMANCSCVNRDWWMDLQCNGVKMSVTRYDLKDIVVTCSESTNSALTLPLLRIWLAREIILDSCLPTVKNVRSIIDQLDIGSIGYVNVTGVVDTLASGQLANLTSVRDVYLIGVGLTHIDPFVFGDENTPDSRISQLYMTRNNISEIDHRVFNKLTQLSTLYLSNNQLSALPDDLFQHNKKLTSLNLSNNKLEDFSSALLRSIVGLETLDLSHNRLKHLSDEISKLDNLSSLDLSHNQLTSLGEGEESVLRNMHKLGFLYLGNNNLTRLYPDWVRLKKILILGLPNNNIQSLKVDIFSKATQGADVNIIGNNITVVNADVQEVDTDTNTMKPWVIVHLKDNPFNCDCHLHSFVWSTHLRPLISFPKVTVYLSTDKYQMCSSPPSLKGRLINDLALEELTCPMTDRCPTDCSCYYQPEGAFTVVNCSGVGKRWAPEDMPAHPNSSHTKLIMSNNRLDIFDYSPNRRPNVTHLLLSNMNLTKFTLSGGVGPLKMLDISQNQLSSLSRDTVRALWSLDSLSLHLNPWRCSCDDWHLIRLVKNLDMVTILHIDQVKCQDERVMKDLSYIDVCPRKN